jgi:GNAT superfamily N-acetyltransferase
MTVNVAAFEQPDEFVERVGGFLRERALENNLPLAIGEGLVRDPPVSAPLLLMLASGAQCIGAALMPRGRPLVVTDLPKPAVLALAEYLHSEGLEVDELHAPEACAGRLVFELERRGRPFVLKRTLLVYGVAAGAELVPPASPGRTRPAEPPDRALLAQWFAAFGRETGFVIDAPEEFARTCIATHRASVYEEAGEVVSLVCIGGHARGLSRIGPVYTPPERRGRGYGSALVGAVTLGILQRGEQACLFADADNPTSNRIYVRLGYRELGRVATYERSKA